MEQIEAYIWLLGLIVIVGLIGRKTTAPTPLLLVIAGMIISFIPHFPQIELHPNVVLNIFLPLLVYEASAYTSWPDVKLNKRPIALLSIGHVIFITLLVAIAAHAIIPGMSWAMAFVLGAVVSPPDDVAIFSVAEKVSMPRRILTVLMGEGLLNDATALIIYRFSLVAVITHQFSPVMAVSHFFLIIIGETLWGLFVGNVIGQIRLRINEPMLQMLLSILTPFIAYIPASHLGGSGILATVVTGLVLGHAYLDRFTPGARLLWHAVWETIGFTVSSILFMLVGLNFYASLQKISMIPTHLLFYYGISITLVVIVGRFIWVYPSAYLPLFLFPSLRKKEPYPSWKYPFIVSWAGMRGGVSLAAALAFPILLVPAGELNLRDMLIFLVFCVITATLLIQGLTLPWLLKKFGLDKIGQLEKSNDQLDELSTKAVMAEATLHWLTDYEEAVAKDNPDLLEEVRIQKLEYSALHKRINEILECADRNHPFVKSPKQKSATVVFKQIIDVEREILVKLWREGKISLNIRNNLLQQLDLRAKRYGE